jgi:uncharacterized integral membrane protein (TIGR00698 family)
MSQPERKVILSEDWAAVWLGLLLIGFILLQVVVFTPSYNWKGAHELSQLIFSLQNFKFLAAQATYAIVVVAATAWLTSKPVLASLKIFLLVFAISQLALLIAGNATVKSLNLEAVIISLFLGLAIGHTFKIPASLRALLSTELYVKIGLVLLGTSIIFSDLLKAGSLGLIQSLVVVISVWYVAFWISKKLRVDEELALMLSSAVSICGVSAAIATAGAIKGDSKKLSFVISLVLVTAIPMMLAMPVIANYFQFSDKVTGAWLGGTIDTTGAVVAAGSLVGEEALKVATIVKFSQNVLLGLAAFAISIYWSYAHQSNDRQAVSLSVIWQRFPKFVIGFVAVSILFSWAIPTQLVGEVKDSIKSLQTLWFVLAFTSIGLETKFTDIFHVDNRKPLYAFLLAQFFNIVITLVVAWALFGKS